LNSCLNSWIYFCKMFTQIPIINDLTCCFWQYNIWILLFTIRHLLKIAFVENEIKYNIMPQSITVDDPFVYRSSALVPLSTVRQLARKNLWIHFRETFYWDLQCPLYDLLLVVFTVLLKIKDQCNSALSRPNAILIVNNYTDILYGKINVWA